MLDRDGQMVLVYTTDCKLIDPHICLQMPMKTEADLDSLRLMMDRRGSKAGMPHLDWPHRQRARRSTEHSKANPHSSTLSDFEVSHSSSRTIFKRGQLRNDESFDGKSIPFTLNLDSVRGSPKDKQQADAFPKNKLSFTTRETLAKRSDSWAFKLKTTADGRLIFDKQTHREPSVIEKSPSKQSITQYSIINDNFAEVLEQTIERHRDVPVPHKLATSERRATFTASQNLRKKYRLVEEPRVFPNSSSIAEILRQKKQIERSLKRSVTTVRPRGSVYLRAKIGNSPQLQKDEKNLSPLKLRSQGSV
jgi:hypothetical protein